MTGWSASPSGAVIFSGSGNSRTVTRAGSFDGEVTLTCTLNTGCGSVDVERTVWVGYGVIQSVDYPLAPVAPFTVVPIAVYMMPDGDLDLGPHKIEVYQGGPTGPKQTFYGSTFTLYQTGLYHVEVFPGSACGYSWQSYPFMVTCSTGAPFIIYPNPADGVLTVSLGTDGETGKAQRTPQATAFTAILYDSSGREHGQGASKDGSDIVFDTARLPDGTYFVYIHSGGQVEKRQVAIRH